MGANEAHGRFVGSVDSLFAERMKRLEKGLFSFVLLWVRLVKSVDRLFYISAI